MKPIPLLCSFLLFLSASAFSEEDRPTDPSTWLEIPVPPATPCIDHTIWSYAANYSPRAWRVFRDGDKVLAALTSEQTRNDGPLPTFASRSGRFNHADAFTHVSDGWLVGNNMGEFGASLYWFSDDGKQEYKISDHQVVEFIPWGDRIFAIEGLAHLGMSRGSLIEVTQTRKPTGEMQWVAKEAVKLPQAPYAATPLRNGDLLAILSDSLVSIAPDNALHTLLADAPWGSLYVNSAVLSADESKLYIGMREYVGEFDLSERSLRMLVPSKGLHNRLSEDSVRSLEKQCRNAQQ